MTFKATYLAVLLALASLVGCAPMGSGKGGEGTLGGKADCANQDACTDAAEDSALAQLGLQRFLREGDGWTVAWVYRNDDQMNRTANQQVGNSTFTEPVLIRYEVLETGEQSFGSRERRVATVQVTEVASSAGPAPIQTLVAAPFGHVDTRIDYTINELFNPVSKTFYRTDILGRTVSNSIDLDGRSNLTMQFDSLPNGYPNLDRIRPRDACDARFFERLNDPDRREYTACWGGAPENVPSDLAEIADAAGVDIDAAGLHIGPTASQPDYMFWQAGKLHPTFVSGPRGLGVLVSQSR